MNIKNVLYIHLLYTLIICYSNNYEKLYNWLISNGAYISKKLIPKEQSLYNRYIVTGEKINQKEELLFIPNKLTISTLNDIVLDKCQKDFMNYYSSLTREEISSFDYDCLVYFLTIDIDNNQSFFKNYYNYLPEISQSDFPLYFTDEEKNILSKIELDTQISRQDIFLEKALMPVKNKIIKIENGLEKFKKNFIYVSTRNFGRRGSFYDDVNTLVPYLDLLNHSNDYNSWFYYDEKRDGFILYAIKNIEKNEEITISYGKFNNLYLYSMYGFTIKDNIYKSSIYIKIKNKKFVLFEKVKEGEIIKIINFFKPTNISEKNNLILEIKNALENKLKEYEKYVGIFKNNINIVNICDDLKWIAKEYILLCEKMI